MTTAPRSVLRAQSSVLGREAASSPISDSRPLSAFQPFSLSAFQIDHLPGADLIHRGLQDHHASRHTIESHLVEIARPRLERAGLLQPAPHRLDSEIQLYQLLARDHPNPHGRYNSLLRELVSFEHALDHRLAKAQGRAGSPSGPNLQATQSPSLPSTTDEHR